MCDSVLRKVKTGATSFAGRFHLVNSQLGALENEGYGNGLFGHTLKSTRLILISNIKNIISICNICLFVSTNVCMYSIRVCIMPLLGIY